MPMFEYRCKQCGHHMDVLVKSSQQKISVVVCDKCGSKDTEKAIAGFSVGQGSPSSSCPTCCPTGTCGLP
jgi:putative FmdB family regulatory protein